MTENIHSYRFNFRKDGGVKSLLLLLPLSILCWILLSLIGSNNVIIKFLCFFIIYPLGGLILSLIRIITVQVTFTDLEIFYRKTLKTEKISKKDIIGIDMNANGGIDLYYHIDGKRLILQLPKFKEQPDYLEEFNNIKAPKT